MVLPVACCLLDTHNGGESGRLLPAKIFFLGWGDSATNDSHCESLCRIRFLYLYTETFVCHFYLISDTFPSESPAPPVVRLDTLDTARLLTTMEVLLRPVALLLSPSRYVPP